MASVPTGRMSSDTVRLSRREHDVLRLAALGLTNLEIAAQLGLCRSTVCLYLRRAYAKLCPDSSRRVRRGRATCLAIKHGLI